MENYTFCGVHYYVFSLMRAVYVLPVQFVPFLHSFLNILMANDDHIMSFIQKSSPQLSNKFRQIEMYVFGQL